MRRPFLLLAVAAIVSTGAAPRLRAQNPQPAQQGTDTAKAAKRERKQQKAFERAQRGDTANAPKPARLFAEEGILAFTLTANYGRIERDRQKTPPYRWGSIAMSGGNGAPLEIPVEVRSRGIWRRHNCDLPPLRLHFDGEQVKHTAFARQKNLKLVVHCRDTDEFEQYILQEFQLYRVYNLLTPMSHLARLARVSYVDSGKTKPFATRYAFLLEDVDDLAERNAAMVVKQQGAQPGDLEPTNAALLGVFEYFIGNTDFSIGALHNIEILQRAMSFYGVAHDFDFSGAINTRYATVDSRLRIQTVRQRLFRGYCVPAENYTAAFALFDAKKDAIYALYRDSYGKLLAPDRLRGTLEYIDDFYRVIDDPRAAQHEIVDQCLGR